MENKPTSVTIVGLTPQQARRVEAQFAGQLDINCIDAGLSHSKIQAAAESSDYVVVMTRFLPHKAQTAVREHGGLIFCNGAETAVKQQLDQLVNGLHL